MVLDLFEKYNIDYSIKTIYIGLRTNFICRRELENFAIDLIGLDEYKDNTFINDLIFEIDNMNMDIILCGIEQTFNLKEFKYSDDEFKEFLKIQYIMILNELQNLENNKIDSIINLFDNLIHAFYLLYNLSRKDYNMPKIAEENMLELENILYDIYPTIENTKSDFQKLYNYMDKLKMKIV